jgi:acetamidase/formamidase
LPSSPICSTDAHRPARENGGNNDIKNFTRGLRVFYPVHVPGAKFSGGDLHFSQGDGEITFCGAIEMGGFVDVRPTASGPVRVDRGSCAVSS